MVEFYGIVSVGWLPDFGLGSKGAKTGRTPSKWAQNGPKTHFGDFSVIVDPLDVWRGVCNRFEGVGSDALA